jgi:hypothetical protein
VDKDSVQFNSKLLRDNNFDVSKLLANEKGSTLDFGSEFRPMDQLEQVLGGHPNFADLREVVQNGMSYHLKAELSEADRLQELSAILERGNHQSATNNVEKATALINKDVLHGFSIPVDPDIVMHIKHAQAEPLGLVSQTTVNDAGDRIDKYRLTQDLSFSYVVENAAINARIDLDEYPEMIYGWCLLRILTFMVALRWAFPNKRILIAKYDYSDAYRRMCHSAKAAAQSIAVIAGIAYIALRLTFGGSANPPTWCMFSEMVTDLSNELLMCPDWDPKLLRSPAQPNTPTPKLLPDNVPIAPACLPAVLVPVTTTTKTDGYIDDLMNVCLDTPENRERAPHAVPLIMHLTSRPHAGEQEPIPRRGILSKPKLLAEGTHAELQILLGWLINSRLFTIALPPDKHQAWAKQLAEVVASGSATFAEIESIVGRLNHAAAIIPLARHFLNRIRYRIKKRTFSKQRLSLTEAEKLDLLLWIKILAVAANGISINRVVVRQPDIIIWSDSCPYGVGGYHLSGRAWRIKIPEASPLFGEKTINNYLEFLGMVINTWLVCLERPHDQLCILALGDSTSGIGWIFSSGRVDPSSTCFTAIQAAARHLATLVLQSSHCLATQHIRGEENIVADLLSFAAHRDKFNPLAFDDPADDVLTERFHSFLSPQIPKSFTISHLPPEILSWVTQQLAQVESSLILNRKKATKGSTGHGGGGKDSATKQAWEMTPTSLLFPATKPNWLPGPFSRSSETLASMKTAGLQQSVASRWSAALSGMPQAAWLRRSGVIYNKAPSTSRTAPSFIQP